MFSLFLFSASAASTNAKVFKLEGSTKCPAEVTVEVPVADLNTEIQGSIEKDITVYVGLNTAKFDLANIMNRDVKFIGCSAKTPLEISGTPAAASTTKISLTNFAATYTGAKETIETGITSLTLKDSALNFNKDDKVLKITSTAVDVDVASLTNSGLQLTATNVVAQLNSKSDVQLRKDKYYLKTNETRFVAIGTEATLNLFNEEQNIDFFEMTKKVKLVAKKETKLYLEADKVDVLSIDNTDFKVDILSHNKDTFGVTVTNKENLITSFLEKVSDKLNAGQIIGVVIAALLCVASILACVFIVRCEDAEQKKEEEARLTSMENDDASV